MTLEHCQHTASTRYSPATLARLNQAIRHVDTLKALVRPPVKPRNLAQEIKINGAAREADITLELWLMNAAWQITSSHH